MPKIRVLIAMLTAFGALRGLQDMRTPLWVALGSNALNIALDPLLIFGWGPIPAWGLAGAAWASTVSHLVGAIWALYAVQRRLPHAASTGWAQALAFLRVGGNLVIRTGALLFFLILATRTATRAGTEAGAIHQVVRQVWVFTAFALDAFAGSAQSLVSYFLGADDAATARRVARISCAWALMGGIVLCLVTLALEDAARIWLLPSGVVIGYAPAWRIAALAQPVSALSFVTDGIHWGSSDYRYLRNGMLVSTAVGAVALLAVDPSRPDVLTLVWAVTAGWLLVRAAWGLLRIWPGVGGAPLSGRVEALARPGDGRAAG